MARPARSARRLERPPHCDGLGRRDVVVDRHGQRREVLSVVPELTAVPAFEFALRERVSRLAGFRHPHVVPVLGVERPPDREGRLTVVSEMADGIRVSDYLLRPDATATRLDIPGSLAILRSLMGAVVDMHAAWRDLSHGALGPERIVIADSGQVLVTECVFGAALAQLQYSQERYWRDLRFALPRSTGLPRLDQRADVTQVGVVALSLLLGRPLRADEYPMGIVEALTSARMHTPGGGTEPLPGPLRDWLVRALHLDPRLAYGSALAAFDDLMALRLDLPTRAERPRRVEPRDTDAAGLPSVGTLAAESQCTVLSSSADLGLDTFPSEADPPLESNTAPPGGSAPDDFPDFPVSEATGRTGAAPAESRTLAAASGPTVKVAARGSQAPPLTPVVRGARSHMVVATVVAAALATAILVMGVLARVLGDPVDPRTTGTVTIATVPAGAAAILNGRWVGMTPLTIDVEAGTHTLELRGADGRVRILPVRLAPGRQLEQYIEMGAGTSPESTLPQRSDAAQTSR
ncbi:MAG: PEGA domain-containing protein [Vicinamibacterales bacterium]